MAHDVENFGVVVEAFELPEVGAKEGSLKGEAMDDVELPPNDSLDVTSISKFPTLAEPSRSLFRLKWVSFIEKTSQFFFISRGMINSFLLLSLAGHPSLF